MFLIASVSANKPIDYKEIGFYHLAGNRDVIDGEKIQISGWLFSQKNGEYSFYLFPDKESMEFFKRVDSLIIRIPQSKGGYVENHFSERYVTIVGRYNKVSNYDNLGVISKIEKLHCVNRALTKEEENKRDLGILC